VTTLKAASSGLLSVPRTAEVLGIKEATLRSWILCRRIEVIRIGRRVLFRPDTIEALIARGTVPADRDRELA
jgi:excisionase family DNA binding protein